jgi:hypothetical protein
VEKEILDLAKLHKVRIDKILFFFDFEGKNLCFRLSKKKVDLIFVVHKKNGPMLHEKWIFMIHKQVEF